MPSSDASEPGFAPDIVSISGGHFSWPGRNVFSLTIDSFALKPESKVLLIGPSGSGKSTFLSLLCGMVALRRCGFKSYRLVRADSIAVYLEISLVAIF